jgi:hypothetical protein
MRLFLSLEAWCQRHLNVLDDWPPYPLTQDEWDAMQDDWAFLKTEQQVLEDVSKGVTSKSFVNVKGELEGFVLGGGIKLFWLRLFL